MSRRSARESKKVVYEDFVDYDEFDDKPARGRRKSTGRKATKVPGSPVFFLILIIYFRRKSVHLDVCCAFLIICHTSIYILEVKEIGKGRR